MGLDLARIAVRVAAQIESTDPALTALLHMRKTVMSAYNAIGEAMGLTSQDLSDEQEAKVRSLVEAFATDCAPTAGELQKSAEMLKKQVGDAVVRSRK